MKSRERRHLPRKALERLAYIHIEPDNGGIIPNVSGEGLCFQSVAPVDQDRPLLFSLFEHNRSIAGSGCLVWTDETHKLGGLRFTALDFEARNQISEWMNQRTAAPEANAARGFPAREYDPPVAVLAGGEIVTGAKDAAQELLPGHEEHATAPVPVEMRTAAAPLGPSTGVAVPFPAGKSSTLEIAFRSVDLLHDRFPKAEANSPDLATVAASTSRAPFSARKLAIVFTTAALLGLGMAMLFTRNPRDARPVRALVRPPEPVVPRTQAPAQPPQELEAPAAAPPKPVAPADDQRPSPAIAPRQPAEKRARPVLATRPLPSTADPGPTDRVAISGAPQFITYPSAPRPGLAGKVRLKLVVGTDGSVTGVTVVAGNPILANAAVRSVRHWRYPRTEVGGRAVEAETTVTISFLGPDVVTINFRP